MFNLDRKRIPNLLTVSRFFTSPLAIVFIFLDKYVTNENTNIYLETKIFGFVAACLFFISSFTDFLDGYLSRKWNCVSNFGKTFDPIADKVLVIGTLFALMISGKIFLPIGIILIARDIAMDLIRLKLYKKNIIFGAIKSAKWKTGFQMVGLCILLFFFNKEFNYSDWKSWLGHVCLFISAFFSIYSFVVYLKNIYR